MLWIEEGIIMGGTITKLTLLRHPFLVVGLFGWGVWLKGLAMQRGTFLDVVEF
jgi:hypothetical protein